MSTRRTLQFATVLLAVSGLALTACSSGTPDATSQSDSPSTSGATQPEAGDQLLGIVSITATDSNNARVIAGATEAAEAAGWKVEVVDAQGNADTANAAIRNFVSKDATAVFDLVFPVSSLGAGLQATKDAGIPVATWGGGLGDGVVMTTGDGGPFAEPATQAMLDEMEGSGSVLALTYRGGQVCRDREAVLDEMLKENPDIKVTKSEVNIPGFLQDGSRHATAWLAAHPGGSENLAIWGCWEDPTLGAISALQQQGRTDVLTYGINGSSTAIKAVQDGTLTATVYEDGKGEGAKMFEVVQEAMEAGESWEQQAIDVPGILVTAENVDAFLKDHPEALQ
ncbi:sugar ABC transporter substrate-binding protein [Tessaracoccus sp. MC1756]|uniref:sugar ABC transporter substrate-binding protein n=1 Tax=Tessaracoccus sp. MC1756 TaxID=2760311 RepID=UPI00160386A0|nr:sugar ABC transporter substrate-binding protein [Tessaracoccus sp. MC1756]MBB1509324.1 sugar ABC transporter substrate-binding protein [Tessaracoccus sp. MC1756]